jgi:HEAT repeat protein
MYSIFTKFNSSLNGWNYPLLSLILLSPTFIFSSTQSDKIISSGLDSQKVQVVVETLRSIKESNAKHFIPNISLLLKKENLDKDIIIEIINLYESYGDDLIEYTPSILDDYEWLLNHLEDDRLLLDLIQVLYQKKDKRFIYSILTKIHHRSYDIREITFKYLKLFKDDRILPFILELGSSENPLYRYYYLEALEHINDERVTFHLGKLINDESAAIRYEAIKLMDSIQNRDKENQILLLSKIDPNFEVRKISIIYAKNRKVKNRMNIFVDGLEDPNEEVRNASLDSITYFKDPIYAKKISHYLEQENNSILKLKAIEALIAMKNDGGGAGLSTVLLYDKDSEVRTLSAIAIGNISKQKNLVTTLNESLNIEYDIKVKTEIIRSISIKKEKSSIPFLLSKIRDPKESLEIKNCSLNALEEINDPIVLPELFEMLYTQVEISEQIKIFIKNMLFKFHGIKNKLKSF